MGHSVVECRELEQQDFDFTDLEQELKVDERCRTLLGSFYQHLQADGMDAQNASELAFAADYYLRDYLLDYGRQNVVRPVPGIVRYFAANWFITHTLDPEMAVLGRHLESIRRLYAFLHLQHLISVEELRFLEAETGELDYYAGRIDSFLSIEKDGYVAWEAACARPF
ncbi:MAG TPA: hypothetical protein PLN25_10945 [Deltaproteobacteria bacterium]|nr:hypothetical protein [Deltaproteobacteria bacterium]HQB39419.1 hypothetical protein [Deltaproteobacteria bacterium]